MPVFVFLMLCLKGENSNKVIYAAFSNKYFSGKTSFPVKNSYLLKSEVLAVCLSKSY